MCGHLLYRERTPVWLCVSEWCKLWATLGVCESGCGFGWHVLECVFVVFECASRCVNGSVCGSGKGMCVCASICMCL